MVTQKSDLIKKDKVLFWEGWTTANLCNSFTNSSMVYIKIKTEKEKLLQQVVLVIVDKYFILDTSLKVARKF